MTEFLGYFSVFLATLAGVEFFRRWSLRKKLFDVPNERSSHTVPTPRGGGLVVVIVCLTAYVVSTVFLTGEFRWSYLLGAFAVALISWIDDLYTISSVWRFAVHIGSALLIIFTLGYFEEISFPLSGSFNFGVVGAVLTFFWIVWLTNAYNFMDGIDGIAGLQTLTAGIGWYFCGVLQGAPAAGFYGGILAAAGLGFLFLNWQPAKIFMGDVGSAFLGYSFAVLPLLAKNEKTVGEKGDFLLPAAIVLVWLFVFDTLWTFGRRVLKGEKVWQAHRGHIYQRLVINGFSHAAVSLLYGIFSILNVLLLILFLRSGISDFILPAFIFIQTACLAAVGYFFGKQK